MNKEKLNLVEITNNIKTIHSDNPLNDYTLCGVPTSDWNPDYKGNYLEVKTDPRQNMKLTNKKVNCPDCLRIINHVKTLLKEWLVK